MNQEYPHAIAILYIITVASPILAYVGNVLRRSTWKRGKR